MAGRNPLGWPPRDRARSACLSTDARRRTRSADLGACSRARCLSLRSWQHRSVMHSITDRVGRTSVPRHHAPGLLRPDPADRLLVLAPHPDDESLAIGGLLRLARAVGASVRVIYLTSGENNPWAQRACERRWRIGFVERQRWGRRREGETLASLARL